MLLHYWLQSQQNSKHFNMFNFYTGTFPGGIDVMPFKSAGLFNSVKVKDLRLQNGAKYSVTIRGKGDYVTYMTVL